MHLGQPGGSKGQPGGGISQPGGSIDQPGGSPGTCFSILLIKANDSTKLIQYDFRLYQKIW